MSSTKEQVGGMLMTPRQKIQEHRDSSSARSVHQMPLAHLLPHVVRGHVVAMLGEFIGTFMFLFFAFAGTQVANSTQADGLQMVAGSSTSILLYICLSFGFSLAINVWTFFRISGGLFNPAVTLGMWLIGAVPWFRSCLLVVAQMLGAMSAAAVVEAILPGPLVVSTTLTAGTTTSQGLFLEMFLTAQLVFTIFMLAAEKHRANFIAPIGIGLALFVAELAGVLYTGGSLNPARSFAPHVVVGAWPGYHWIYWLGPFLGSMLAAAFYKLIKILEYETATPNADESGGDDETSPESEQEAERTRGARSSSRAHQTADASANRHGGTRRSMSGPRQTADASANHHTGSGRPSSGTHQAVDGRGSRHGGTGRSSYDAPRTGDGGANRHGRPGSSSAAPVIPLSNFEGQGLPREHRSRYDGGPQVEAGRA